MAEPEDDRDEESRTPDQRRLRDIPVVSVLTDWDRPKAKAALHEHDQGFFFASAQLVEDMLRDDRVSSVLETYVLGLLGNDVKVTEPKGFEDDLDAKEAAAELEARWDAMLPDDVLKAVERWVVMIGFALCELLWSGDETGWHFTLRLWDPRFVWYDFVRRQYVVNTADGPVWIKPGDGKWFLFCPNGEYRGWIHAAVRSLADPVLARMYNSRDWARFCEIYGAPARIIDAPSDAPEPEKDKFFDRVANMGANNTLLCTLGVGDKAQNWNYRLVEATATGWQAFQAFAQMNDTRISIRIVGQNLTTEAGSGAGGTYGSAEVHNLVRLDYKRAGNKSLKTALREQCFKPWCRYNWGRSEIAPDAGWQIEPPDDRKAAAEILAQVASAIAILQQSPDADTRQILERFDVPVVDEGDVPPPEETLDPPSQGWESGETELEPGEEGAGAAEGAFTSRTRARARARLSKPRTIVTPKASKRAQDYVEDLASIARDKAAEAMAPNLKKVLAAIERAASYDELRPLLADAFQQLDPTELAHVAESSLVLSQLAGRHAIHQDVHAHAPEP